MLDPVQPIEYETGLFRDLCARVISVLKVIKTVRAVVECNLRTFKTSLVTINHEMHDKVFIYYMLKKNYSITVSIVTSVLH